MAIRFPAYGRKSKFDEKAVFLGDPAKYGFFMGNVAFLVISQ